MKPGVFQLNTPFEISFKGASTKNYDFLMKLESLVIRNAIYERTKFFRMEKWDENVLINNQLSTIF